MNVSSVFVIDRWVGRSLFPLELISSDFCVSPFAGHPKRKERKRWRRMTTTTTRTKRKTRKDCISFALEPLCGPHGNINAHAFSLGQPGEYIGGHNKGID